GEAPITPDFVLKLGYAAGKVLARVGKGAERRTVLIGKDTRISGYMLESALEAGLCAAGVDVLLVGPMPTPAVAYLTRALRLSAGIVISASHNPYADNGIKFFSGAGAKLADKVESAIETELARPLKCSTSAQLGKVRRIDDAAGRYVEFCKSTFPAHFDLRGLRLVIDSAHGATYHIAAHVFHELGADVVAKGEVYDGDQLLYVIASYRMRQRRQLRGGVVGTLMTNLGMEHALARLKIPFARAKVGDRYVLEMMQKHGWVLGGENSGHIICLDQHTTGDGLVSALQVLGALRGDKTTLAKAAAPVKLFRQLLINVRIRRDFDFSANRGVRQAVAQAEAALGADGRVLLRASGTEPVIRVMVEGKRRPQVKTWADAIAAAVRKAAG
ncbi:MAG: phosphoglucosamine mutase, partial [Proteobacteria bacterium]|nr:phosphoglucosamine mutase [Pseudomonadota bacterium]